MSFFGLFKKKKPKELTMKEARSYFQTLKESSLADIEEEKQHLSTQIMGQKNQIFEAIENLKHATLLNAKIPARELSIMEGNRRSYLSQVGFFLDSIPHNPFEAYGVYNQRIQGFLKATFRSYQVLTQFFETELNEVAGGLKKLGQAIEEIGGLLDTKEQLETVTELFEEIDGVAIRGKQSKKRQRQQQDAVKQKQQDIEKVEEETAHLKASKGFKAAIGLKERLEQIKAEEIALAKNLYQILGKFSKLLRKYHNLKDDPISLRMEEAPVDVFYNSPKEVIRVLSDIADLIIRDQIIVKPSEKQKQVMRLHKIDKQTMLRQHQILSGLRKQILKLKTEIEEDKSLQKMNKLRHIKTNLKREKAALEQLVHVKLQPIRPSAELKQELEEELSRLGNQEISLSS